MVWDTVFLIYELFMKVGGKFCLASVFCIIIGYIGRLLEVIEKMPNEEMNMSEDTTIKDAH